MIGAQTQANLWQIYNTRRSVAARVRTWLAKLAGGIAYNIGFGLS